MMNKPMSRKDMMKQNKGAIPRLIKLLFKDYWKQLLLVAVVALRDEDRGDERK